MKIQNAFRLGLLGGLGVLVALAIGGAIVTLSTILTYVGAALFLALGLDPVVSWLERHKFPRWTAILTVLVALLAVLAGLVLSVVPVIIDQTNRLISQVPTVTKVLSDPHLVKNIQNAMPDFINVQSILDSIVKFFQDPSNLTAIGDIEYTRWSVNERTEVDFAVDATPTAMQENQWHDTVTLRAGAEWQRDELTARVGGYYDPSPVPAEHLTPTAPDGSRVAFTAGAGYRISAAWSADAFAEQMWILRRDTTSVDTMPASYGGTAVVFGLGVRWTR